jgi:hypothetical protein
MSDYIKIVLRVHEIEFEDKQDAASHVTHHIEHKRFIIQAFPNWDLKDSVKKCFSPCIKHFDLEKSQLRFRINYPANQTVEIAPEIKIDTFKQFTKNWENAEIRVDVFPPIICTNLMDPSKFGESGLVFAQDVDWSYETFQKCIITDNDNEMEYEELEMRDGEPFDNFFIYNYEQRMEALKGCKIRAIL